MLFGRKTPPTATPKPEPAPAVPEAGAAAPGVSATPLAQPAAGPASSPSGTLSPTSPQPSPAPTFNPPHSDKGPEMNTTPPKPPVAPSIPGSSFKPTDIPRRTVDLPGVTPRKPDGYAAPAPAPTPVPAAIPAPVAAPVMAEQRRLTVGRDISLSGEIGSCDILVVEGTVEAKLRDGRSIEIAEHGLFKGSVEIDEADIGGRFEGDISVRGRLLVRSTGRITGSIKYGELAVEAGGQLTGDIQSITAAAKPAAAPVAAPAAAPAPAATPAPIPVAADAE